MLGLDEKIDKGVGEGGGVEVNLLFRGVDVV